MIVISVSKSERFIVASNGILIYELNCLSVVPGPDV